MPRDPNRQYKRAPGAGRPRIPDAVVLAAIDYRRRTGCGWGQIPRSLGAHSTIHRRYKEMVNAGQCPPVPNWREMHPDPLAELRALVSPAQTAAALSQGGYDDLYTLHSTQHTQDYPHRG